MVIKYLILLLFILSNVLTFGQNRLSVNIIDRNSDVLPGVTLLLFKQQDTINYFKEMLLRMNLDFLRL